MRWISASLLLLLASPQLWAQASEAREEQTAVEEALDLRLRLEELLDSLSPELRAEFERRWAARDDAKAPDPPSQPVEDSPPNAAAEADAVPGNPVPKPITVVPDPPSRPAEGPATADAEAPAESPTSQAQDQAPDQSKSPTPVEGHEQRQGESQDQIQDQARDQNRAQAQVREPVPAAPDPLPEAGEHVCNTLHILDTNGDGSVSGSDRFWRYLTLWTDNGNGVPEENEVKSLFKHKIRKVSARLYTYTTTKDADGGIWVEDRIYFDLGGRGQRSRPALTLNAGGLGRSGDTWVEDADGNRLEGLVPISRGIALGTSDGGRYEILCQ